MNPCLQNSGKSYSSIHTIRGVLRPAFQMAVDDEVIRLNPFDFQVASVLIDDRGRREAISKKEMEKFLKFVHDDNCYYKYYEAFYILFHTGLRISEFCGLTVKDLDMEKQILNVDHQLQRRGDSRYIIETTKTNAGTRRIPMTGDVYACYQSILESRRPSKPEPTTRMENLWSPCTGSTILGMRSTVTMRSTEYRCRRLRRMYAATPTTRTWKGRG